ncbi:TIGR04076 family protein [Microbacter sp. GSS18]|nr:TIGR04076 family protein [Microbacter sp. GSS18]
MLQNIRVTVVKAENAKHGAEVGDCFEIRPQKISIPEGKAFPLYLLSAVVPVLLEKQMAVDPTSWINRKPFLISPDANEQVVVKMEIIEEVAP